MSFFAETSWEANAVGDKLSTEIFNKNNKRARKERSFNVAPKSNSAQRKHNSLRQASKTLGEETTSKKLTTNHARRREKKRQKVLSDAIETGIFPPKKWEKKSRQNVHESRVKPPDDEQKSCKKQKLTNQNTPPEETKSQRRRKKKKLKRVTEKQDCVLPGDKSSPVLALPGKPSSKNNLNIKRLETMLAVKEKTKNTTEAREPESLRDRMMSQLRASRFRFLNETLYNNDSSESKKYFKEDPDAFAAYHAGYKQQVQQWPLNPLDIIISAINKMPKDYIIADFGCGEARLAESVSQKVHSFDLVAVNDKVRACDMAHTPLLTCGVNVVVFCLSLMGTNLADYLLEANRVLKIDGIMKIADVESRFENVDDFIALLKSYGFIKTWKDLSHNLFYFVDFKKVSEVNRNTKKLPTIALKPCLYKKR